MEVKANTAIHTQAPAASSSLILSLRTHALTNAMPIMATSSPMSAVVRRFIPPPLASRAHSLPSVSPRTTAHAACPEGEKNTPTSSTEAVIRAPSGRQAVMLYLVGDHSRCSQYLL